MANISAPQKPAASTPCAHPGFANPYRRKCWPLSQFFEESCIRFPQAIALVCGEERLSYAELDARANRLAHHLLRIGAAPARNIGMFLERRVHMYVALLAILKAGSAYVPLDPSYPPERIAFIAQDAGVTHILTTSSVRANLPQLPSAVVELDRAAGDVRAMPSTRPDVEGGELAYIIHTSGTTGRPKGVAVTQDNVCHFLTSCTPIYGVTASDRVYQGTSITFDLSVEEIWLPWIAGATLIAGPNDNRRFGTGLAEFLREQQITVLDCVPTLLATLEGEIPALRLLVVGGEACPRELLERWWRRGRRILNTYGPTETTVAATWGELSPGRSVTIGRPIPGYHVYLLDDNLRPVPDGEPGEIVIGGPGVARGYVNRPGLTAEKFVPDPAAPVTRMYRTGDLGRMTANGEIEYLGRVDTQIKIRGYRVELGEIENVLLEHPAVQFAVAAGMPLDGPAQEIAAYILLRNGTEDLAWLRNELAARIRQRVPEYMVPTHIEVLGDVPTLASGKVDRRSLPLPSSPRISVATVPLLAPETETERRLAEIWSRIFRHDGISVEADFFRDLGGHSLFAAALVSELRRVPEWRHVGLADLYAHPTVRSLAVEVLNHAAPESRRSAGSEVLHHASSTHETAAPGHADVPASRRLACGLAQAAIVPGFVLLNMADWLAPFFVYHYFTVNPGYSIPTAVLYSLMAFVLARFATFAIAIAGKWLAAGRLKAGRYPLWGLTYFRWWVANRFFELPDVYLLAATPLMPLCLRAFGARIGRDVMIDTITLGAPELLTIEDGVSIGTSVNIENARVQGGVLILGPVHLKRDSVVDSYAVLEDHTTIGRGARLCAQSALAAGRKVPDNQIWEGAPARPSNQKSEPVPPRPHISSAGSWALALSSAATAMVVSVLFFLPAFPAFMLIDHLGARTGNVFDSQSGPLSAFGLLFLLSIPASLVFIGVTVLATAGLRWLLPRQVAGISSVYSLAFWRKRFVTSLLDCSIRILHGLYASVYTPMWLRLMGATVGRHAEVSTAEGLVPELLQMGDDTFVGDDAALGDEEVRGGWMILKPTQIGTRSFIGNFAYVPDGTVVPDDVLIGVQTRAPRNDQLASGQTWLGSPPLLLPARELVTGFPDSLTFRPSRLRRWSRALVEAMRTVLPLTVVIAAGYVIVRVVMPLAEENGWGTKVAAVLSVAGCLYGLASFLLVVALKWTLVGRYRPCATPMWTPFVWISEAVTNIYESLAVPNFLDILRGTPMLPWALRLLGARIGKGVYINTTDVTEFDCVSIGDKAELNAWCGPQTHLFEDRVMKIGWVRIGERVTVGARSAILYDTHVGDGVRLGPLTLVAKGESLPAGTRWEGSPAAPA